MSHQSEHQPTASEVLFGINEVVELTGIGLHDPLLRQMRLFPEPDPRETRRPQFQALRRQTAQTRRCAPSQRLVNRRHPVFRQAVKAR